MCVGFCHRRQELYFLHEDCSLIHCRWANATTPCSTCRHQYGSICKLTNTPLPSQGGCCHHNLDIYQGEREISLESTTMLRMAMPTTIADTLDWFQVPYKPSSHHPDAVMVDIDHLPLPETYGLGTDRYYDNTIDWATSPSLMTGDWEI